MARRTTVIPVDFHVRPFVPADLTSALRALLDGARYPTAERPDDADAYLDAVIRLRDRGHELLVVESEGDVVGVCEVLFLDHFHHAGGRCAEVEAVFVRDEWRGRGAGTALLAEVERRAREAGCYRLQLTSNVARHDAHRFYERLGFTASHVGFKKNLESDFA